MSLLKIPSTGGPDYLLIEPTGARVARGDRRRVEHTFLEGLRDLAPGFGSSAPDTSRSRVATGEHSYFDTVRGNDANSGLTPALARQTLPQFLANGRHDSKVHIAAGSTVVMPGQAAIIPVNNRCTITVYDGDPVSPTFGQEILDQPNPFQRALLGLAPPTPAELATKFYTVAPGTDGTALGSASLSTGAAFSTGSCPDLLVRGAVVQNCMTGFYCNAGASTNGRSVRIEDTYILSAQTDPTQNTSRFGGVGVRGDGSQNCSPNLNLARVWIEGCGEDVFWLGRMTALSGTFRISDFAIIHLSPRQVYNGQHADVFQFTERPGPVSIRRGVIHHMLRDAPLVESGDNSLSTVGGIVVMVGGATGYGDATGTGGLVEDVLMVSNSQLVNNAQPGLELRRCVGAIAASRPNLGIGVTTGTTSALVSRVNGTIAENQCAWGINRVQAQAVGIRSNIEGAAANTQAGVSDVPYRDAPPPVSTTPTGALVFSDGHLVFSDGAPVYA
jgi:hypothetical protein